MGGLTVAHRLIVANRSVIIVDHSLPAANGRLGGFAKFSAQNSLYSRRDKALCLPLPQQSGFTLSSMRFSGSLDCRGTRRCLLARQSKINHSPSGWHHELTELIYYYSYKKSLSHDRRHFTDLIDRATILAATAHRIFKNAGTWTVVGGEGKILATARRIVYAGGRTGGTLLREAGALAQEGKGLDVGIRVEFADRNALSGLRKMGPDAKILSGRCRTFCLNSPGSVYRYKYGDISIPGGVVADAETSSGNVGFLFRIRPKLGKLAEIQRHLSGIGEASYTGGSWVRDHPFPEKRDLMAAVYGEEVVDSLLDFCHRLGRAGMIDWSLPHIAHFPLLDWHWETYAVGPSHRTSLPGLYVVGDSAGHARGLLQAAISGWLAAAEALLDEAA